MGAAGDTTEGARVTWVEVPDPSGRSKPTRDQVRKTRFRRGEGIWFDSGIVYVATTSDDRIYAYSTRTEMIDVLYDGEELERLGKEVPLRDVDNITVHSRSGDLFVCEDDGSEDPLDMGIITPDRQVARFLKLTGRQHRIEGDLSSEVTGVIFDPSGKRMYFASQRAAGVGMIYEVTGPFRSTRARRLTFRASAPDSFSIESFRRRGLPVTTRASRAVDLHFTLQAPAGGANGSSGGARSAASVTIARASRSTTRTGPVETRLKPNERGRQYLRRRRRVRATLRVTAVDRNGNRATVSQPVLLRSAGSPGFTG